MTHEPRLLLVMLPRALLLKSAHRRLRKTDHAVRIEFFGGKGGVRARVSPHSDHSTHWLKKTRSLELTRLGESASIPVAILDKFRGANY